MPDRRDKILKAAAEIFAEKGIERATIDEIAARAGVGKGTIYRRTGNKEDIIKILFKEAILLAIERIESKIQKRIDPLPQFKEAVSALCDVYEDHLDLMLLASFQLALCVEECKCAKKEPRMREEVSQLFGIVEKIFKKAIKKKQLRPIDTFVMAKSFFDLLNPSYYQFLRISRGYTKGEISQLIIDLFLDGLKVRKK